MVQIILSSEQAAQFASEAGPFVLVDPNGKEIGSVDPPSYACSYFTPEEIAEAEAHIGEEGPGITTAELLAKLRKLTPRETA